MPTVLNFLDIGNLFSLKSRVSFIPGRIFQEFYNNSGGFHWTINLSENNFKFLVVQNIRSWCSFFFILTFTLSFFRSYRFSFFYLPLNQKLHPCRAVLVWKVDHFVSSIKPLKVPILKKCFQVWSISNFKLNFFPNYTLGFFHEILRHKMISHLKDSLFWK